MSDAALLHVKGLFKSFGALMAINDLHLDVEEGELHAVIGPNGAGKSTLIRQLTGEMSADAGRILYRGRDITAIPAARRVRSGIARSYQITSVFPEYSALENVAMAVQTRLTRGAAFLRRAAGVPELESPAGELLDRVGLSAERHSPAYSLAHGQQRQLEVAMTLALEPTLLLLDEPMAGMGQQESGMMVDLLSGLRGNITILLVEHDMDAVFALADRVTVLVYGQAIATGSVQEIRNDPEVRKAYLGDEHDVA